MASALGELIPLSSRTLSEYSSCSEHQYRLQLRKWKIKKYRKSDDVLEKGAVSDPKQEQSLPDVVNAADIGSRRQAVAADPTLSDSASTMPMSSSKRPWSPSSAASILPTLLDDGHMKQGCKEIVTNDVLLVPPADVTSLFGSAPPLTSPLASSTLSSMRSLSNRIHALRHQGVSSLTESSKSLGLSPIQPMEVDVEEAEFSDIAYKDHEDISGARPSPDTVNLQRKPQDRVTPEESALSDQLQEHLQPAFGDPIDLEPNSELGKQGVRYLT